MTQPGKVANLPPRVRLAVDGPNGDAGKVRISIGDTSVVISMSEWCRLISAPDRFTS